MENDQVSAGPRTSRWRMSSETALLIFLASLGLIVGADRIADNSMFVHMRTGIEMWTHKEIPRTDPYSFTAQGQPWVVQSWLASGIYGALHALGGFKAVVVLNSVVTGIAAFLIVVMARTGRAAVSVGIGLTALMVAVSMWSPRPLMFGAVCFAIVVFVLDRNRSPLWLLPTFWVWVNTHGSFPAGIGFVVLYLLGSWLDRREVAWKYLLAGIGGVLLGAINPLGPKLLLFWTNALSNGSLFKEISEWSSPDFHSLAGGLLLAGVVLSVAALAAGKRQWRWVLPFTVFLAATLWSVRYAPLLAVVIAPCLRTALANTRAVREARDDAGAQGASDRFRLLSVACVGLAACVAVLVVVRVVTREPLNFHDYPVAAVNSLSPAQKERLALNEWAGCYRVLQEGREAKVFMDDRFDMYPEQVSRDALNLDRGQGSTAEILERYNFTAVVWEKDTPLGNYLRSQDQWRLVYEDKKWIGFVPAGVEAWANALEAQQLPDASGLKPQVRNLKADT